MSSHIDVLGTTALTILVVMVATWLISLAMRDAGIVDIVWGAGFVIAGWAAYLTGDGHDTRSDLLIAMVSIWGLRLAFYLARRNLGKAEDWRYQLMRRKHGDKFAIRSLLTVFGLQGVLMWVVSLPVQLAMTPADPAVGWIAVVGVIVWGVGLFFETVGDAQLTRFKADPDNVGQVLDDGLWRYTRHPNYFGDFCVWWGIFLVAAETGDALFGIIGPIVMTVLLTRVSGVPMLEHSMAKRRPGYVEYVERTSAFFPRAPKPAADKPTS